MIRLPELAAELVRHKVDRDRVLVHAAALSAKQRPLDTDSDGGSGRSGRKRADREPQPAGRQHHRHGRCRDRTGGKKRGNIARTGAVAAAIGVLVNPPDPCSKPLSNDLLGGAPTRTNHSDNDPAAKGARSGLRGDRESAAGRSSSAQPADQAHRRAGAAVPPTGRFIARAFVEAGGLTSYGPLMPKFTASRGFTWTRF